MEGPLIGSNNPRIRFYDRTIELTEHAFILQYTQKVIGAM